MTSSSPLPQRAFLLACSRAQSEVASRSLRRRRQGSRRKKERKEQRTCGAGPFCSSAGCLWTLMCSGFEKTVKNHEEMCGEKERPWWDRGGVCLQKKHKKHAMSACKPDTFWLPLPSSSTPSCGSNHTLWEPWSERSKTRVASTLGCLRPSCLFLLCLCSFCCSFLQGSKRRRRGRRPREGQVDEHEGKEVVRMSRERTTRTFK